jgi:hypothetical protein
MVGRSAGTDPCIARKGVWSEWCVDTHRRVSDMRVCRLDQEELRGAAQVQR